MRMLWFSAAACSTPRVLATSLALHRSTMSAERPNSWRSKGFGSLYLSSRLAGADRKAVRPSVPVWPKIISCNSWRARRGLNSQPSVSKTDTLRGRAGLNRTSGRREHGIIREKKEACAFGLICLRQGVTGQASETAIPLASPGNGTCLPTWRLGLWPVLSLAVRFPTER